MQGGAGFAPLAVDIPCSGLPPSPCNEPPGRAVAYPYGRSAALHTPGEFSAQQAGYSGPQPPPALTYNGGIGGAGGGWYGGVGGTRTVALGQDAGGLLGAAGLTHADFRPGEPVSPACIYLRCLAPRLR